MKAAPAQQTDTHARARGERRVPSDTNREERNPHAPPANRGGERYRCATCGCTFRPWAAAERHADTHGGARIEWLGI